MKRNTHVHLLHNPKAGDQDRIKADLISRIESQGFTCQYASVKEKGWKRFKSETGLIVVAGGDGTVREVLKALLNRRILDKPLPIALVPSGTANNIAKALEVSPGLDEFERSLLRWEPRQIDVGAISKLPGAKFFVEGLGCGVVPELVKQMKGAHFSGVDTTEKELNLALDKLLEIAKNYPATRAVVTIDGQTYTDDYLLIEVLNTKSIGPNLTLAPGADPTDGKFEVALLTHKDRDEFVAYLRRPPQNKDGCLNVPWQVVTATREIIVDCDNRMVHVDDELVPAKKGKRIEIAIRPGIVKVIA